MSHPCVSMDTKDHIQHRLTRLRQPLYSTGEVLWIVCV